MHEYSQSNEISNNARIMTGFMVGAVIGAGIALLLAPATGEETRKRLGETGSPLPDNTNDAIGNVREKFQGGGGEDRSEMGSESGHGRGGQMPSRTPSTTGNMG